MIIDDLMEGFYNNDWGNKKFPKNVTVEQIEAYEMRKRITELVNKKYSVESGYKGEKGSPNRIYLVTYKK